MDPSNIMDLAMHHHISQLSLTPTAPAAQKPPRSEIKKQLKAVVTLSNTIQDENNKLQDMKDAWVPFKDIFKQRLLIGELCCQQYQAIKHLKHIESFYPEEIKNRFFLFPRQADILPLNIF